jgi:hypothetical protein
MISAQDEVSPCRIRGIRITREQCRKRQLGNWRYSRGRNSTGKPSLNPMFISCHWREPDRQFCPWWLSDTEYYQQSTLERQFPWMARLDHLEEAFLDV